MQRLLVISFALAGCEWGGGTDATGNLQVPDAKSAADARRPDAAIDAAKLDGTAANPRHLLLTEIALAGAGAEFVEIYNPGPQPVDLQHYYLSDNGNYFTLPAAVPTISQGDFVVQFSAGATLAAGGVMTVALGTAAAFNAAYGSMPTYSIADATVTVTTASGTPSLTDAGEIVVLFQWDGTSALVKDVDIMLAGAPTASNGLVSKSGYAQLASTYAVDANTIANQASAPAAGTSTKRIAAEPGHETQANLGNGIYGDDETSEDTAATWDATFDAPTPGAVPAL
ncbi:MAG: lamin tail domain-containing protein [Kofleriaceae bacterium]